MAAVANVVPMVLPKGSLFEIQDHLACLFDTLDMCEPQDRTELEGEIDRYLEAEIRKVDGIAGYLAHCEAQQLFAAEEIKRLQSRKHTFEARYERLKQRVICLMEDQGKKKLEGRTSTLMLRACPVSVLVEDDAIVPDEFKVAKTTVSIDKRAIKSAIDQGFEVPGAQLVSGLNTLVRK